MNDSKDRNKELELHAYVDGQLDDEARRQIEEHLQENEQDKQMVTQYQEMNQALGALYQQELQKVTQPLIINKRKPMYSLAIAASFVMFIGGFIISRVLVDTPINPSVVENRIWGSAIQAHLVYEPEVRHPVEVDAKQEAHLVKWLSKRLSTDIKAPHLSQYGYQLVGGRLLPSAKGPAAQFMYENGSGNRLTLYIGHNAIDKKQTAFRFQEQGRLRMFYWTDSPIGYAVIAELQKSDLYDIAHSIYVQLNE